MNHVLLLDQNSFSLLTDPGKSRKQDLKGQKEYKSCNYIQYTYYTQHTNQFLKFVGNNTGKNAMESEFSRQFLSAINYICINDILI